MNPIYTIARRHRSSGYILQLESAHARLDDDALIRLIISRLERRVEFSHHAQEDARALRSLLWSAWPSEDIIETAPLIWYTACMCFPPGVWGRVM